MGMYTEILIKCDLNYDLPDDIKAVLNFLFNGAEEPHSDNLPAHPFFNKSRWKMIGRCSSYYHIPWTNSRYDENRIFSRSDLKDYNDEIDAFFDWIRHYVDNTCYHCIGWKWYEEDREPTLIYAGPPE